MGMLHLRECVNSCHNPKNSAKICALLLTWLM
jgi:hypothetical protein